MSVIDKTRSARRVRTNGESGLDDCRWRGSDDTASVMCHSGKRCKTGRVNLIRSRRIISNRQFSVIDKISA
jgi:hypothetical protein